MVAGVKKMCFFSILIITICINLNPKFYVELRLLLPNLDKPEKTKKTDL